VLGHQLLQGNFSGDVSHCLALTPYSSVNGATIGIPSCATTSGQFFQFK
jgi:hypothetical protein